VRATEFISIPARSQAFIAVKMAKEALSKFQTSAIVKPHVKSTLNKVSVAHMLVNKPPTGHLICRVFNCETRPKNIFRGISNAIITPLSDESVSYCMDQTLTDGSQQLQGARAPLCSSSFSRQESQQENHEQQACALQNGMVHSNSVKPLQQNENALTADKLSSSETQGAITLTDMIKYLKSKKSTK